MLLGDRAATTFLPDAGRQQDRLAEVYASSGRITAYLGDWHTHPRALSPATHRSTNLVCRPPELSRSSRRSGRYPARRGERDGAIRRPARHGRR